jgi:hypothetical protein
MRPVVRNAAPIDERALMSVRHDMEATEPDLGQLRERVQLMPVSLGDTAEVQGVCDAGLSSTRRGA